MLSTKALGGRITGSFMPLPHGWKGWLAVSIAVNLVLIGFVFAWALGMDSPRSPTTWQRDLIPSLSTQDAAVVTNAVQRINDLRSRYDAFNEEQSALFRARLHGSPFDRAAMSEMLERINKNHADQRATIMHEFLDELTALSPDGLAKLTAAMEQQVGRQKPER
jgi:hypothetical protein